MADTASSGGTLWFLVPIPPPPDLQILAMATLTGLFRDAEASGSTPFVYAFSSRARAVAKLAQLDPKRAKDYIPISPPDEPRLIAFLGELQSCGNSAVGIDPSPMEAWTSSPSPNSSGDSRSVWAVPLFPQDRRTDLVILPRWHTEEELAQIREASREAKGGPRSPTRTP